MLKKTVGTLKRSFLIDASKQHIANNEDVIYHDHDFIEYVYVLSGKGIYVINGIEKEIHAGDFFITDYKDMHTYNVIDEETLDILNICFQPRFIDNSLHFCDKYSDVISNYLIKYKLPLSDTKFSDGVFHDHDKKILFLAENIYKELLEKKDAHLEMVRGYLILLTISILREFGKNSYMNYNPITTNVLNYINNHFTQDLSLNNICHTMHYSVPYTSKLIKKETGMTFTDHLHKIRIQHACRFLANTDLKIKDIAIVVGFNDLKNFNKEFKKQIGCTPSEFRNIDKYHIN